MPYVAGGLQGGIGGAELGFTVGGPVGAAIGGGLGFLSGLFSQSPEDQMAERKRELLAAILDARRNAMREVAQETAGQMASARAAASRRALSMGRQSEAESFILPAEQQVSARGFDTSRQIGRQFDQATLQAETDYAGRPIQPGVGDWLMELGGAALEYKQGQDYLETIRNAYQLPNPNASVSDLNRYFSNPSPEIQGITPPNIFPSQRRKKSSLGFPSYFGPAF
jgi:outer membrane murein-binding lipoprotein Lpp